MSLRDYKKEVFKLIKDSKGVYLQIKPYHETDDTTDIHMSKAAMVSFVKDYPFDNHIKMYIDEEGYVIVRGW